MIVFNSVWPKTRSHDGYIRVEAVCADYDLIHDNDYSDDDAGETTKLLYLIGWQAIQVRQSIHVKG